MVPKVDLNGLDSDFLEEEVKKVVWDLRPGKALGSDEFLMFFY